MKLSLTQKFRIYRKFFSSYKKFIKVKQGTRVSEIPFYNHFDTCAVLGNGPSLKKDINNIDHTGKDFVVVNHFSESEKFNLYKPTKYVIIDSYFWNTNAHESHKVRRNKFFSQINAADWDIQLFLPYFADEDFIRSNISNTRINIVLIKALPTSKIDLKNMPLALIDGKLAPPVCNVLIYAVYVAILSGHKEINIYGADYSFHNDVSVDQNNNELYLDYKHFYGDVKREKLMINPDKTRPFTMTLLLRDTHLSFYAHELLNRFSILKGVKIYNKSSNSLIDAYDRN